MTIETLEALNEVLEAGEDSLAHLITPQDFAPKGAVADQMAKNNLKGLNPTQLRKVFHAFKKIERNLRTKQDREPIDADTRAEISLIGPNMAYAVGRRLLPSNFYQLVKTCLTEDKLQTVGDFRRLIQLLSAILAYQKYHAEVKE